MRYCPKRSCEHRRRVGSPAEFVDEVTICSDCGTLLVSADAPELVDGIPRGNDPYRRRGDPLIRTDETMHPRDQRKHDQMIGAAFLVGGIALTAITFALASGDGGGRYIVAYGPILYGLYRLVRGSSGDGAGKRGR